MEDFVIPEFLQDCDVDTIHSKMLGELPKDIDGTEGGFLWDFTRPTALVASELLQFYAIEIMKQMFGQWATGQFLDWLAQAVQIARKAATYATVTLKIEGEVGTAIPSETVFCTEEDADVTPIEFATDEPVVIGESGVVQVTATAVEPGRESNVDADTIIMMSEPQDGIDTVTNPLPAKGGTDEEDDESLRERYLNATRNSDASFIGNMSDFKRWAESVQGMGTAIVMFNWDGPETVKIVCIDANGEAASEAILTDVYNLIMSPGDPIQRLAPPNTILTVAAPDFVEITYSFNVLLAEDFTVETVVENFSKALDEYYKGAAKSGAIRYTVVARLLSETVGVVDFEDLLINGDVSNIAIDEDEYPTTVDIDATEISEV